VRCETKRPAGADGRWPKAEVAQGVPSRLRPQIFLTFATTRVVVRQPYAPAAFTPGEIPGTHFQGLSRPQGTRFLRWEPRKKSPVTPPGIDSRTARLVAQCLNHYSTPGSIWSVYLLIMIDSLFLWPSLLFTTPHSTSLHLSTLHFFPFKVHPSTLHYLSLPSHFLNPI